MEISCPRSGREVVVVTLRSRIDGNRLGQAGDFAEGHDRSLRAHAANAGLHRSGTKVNVLERDGAKVWCNLPMRGRSLECTQLLRILGRDTKPKRASDGVNHHTADNA